MGLFDMLLGKSKLKTKNVIDYNQIKNILTDAVRHMNDELVKPGSQYDKNGLKNLLGENGEIDPINCMFLGTYYASELVMLYNSPIPIDEYNDFLSKQFPFFQEGEAESLSKEELLKKVDNCLMYEDSVSNSFKANIDKIDKKNINVLLIQSNINSLCQKMFSLQKDYKIEQLAPVMNEYFLNTCMNLKAKDNMKALLQEDIRKLEQIYFEY